MRQDLQARHSVVFTALLPRRHMQFIELYRVFDRETRRASDSDGTGYL